MLITADFLPDQKSDYYAVKVINRDKNTMIKSVTLWNFNKEDNSFTERK